MQGVASYRSPRLQELENRFSELAGELEPSPQKEAISVLHGLIQELWRDLALRDEGQNSQRADRNEIAELFRSAPKMEGPSVSEPLPPGTPAPSFTLPDSQGKLVSLEQYRGRNVLLVFYPLDWSPGCSLQLDMYQGELDEFRRRDVEVLAVSVDSIYSHGAWAVTRGLEFPLLADFNPKGEVARRYRVFRDDDGFSERALYLIDAQGVIRYGHVSPQLHHVPDIYELYRQLDELQGTTGSVEAPAGAPVAGAGTADETAVAQSEVSGPVVESGEDTSANAESNRR